MPLGLALATGTAASADDQCSRVTDLRSFRLALQDVTCDTVTLTSELPAITAPFAVERDVVIDVGPWSIPPLHIAPANDAAEGPLVVLFGGVLATDRALSVPAGESSTDARTLPVVLEVAGASTLLLVDTQLAIPVPDEGSTTVVPVLQHADAASTVGLLGVETTEALASTLVYQEGRTDSDACAPAEATFFTDDRSLVLEAVSGAASTIDALTALDDFTSIVPNRITLAPDGGLLGTACWSATEGYGALFGTGPTRVARLVLTGIGTPHALPATGDDELLEWSSIHASGPVELRESLFTDLSTRDVPVISSPVSLRSDFILATELHLTSHPFVAAPEVVFDQSILCAVTGPGALVELQGDTASESVLSRIAVDGLQTPLVSAHPEVTLTLQHLTVRGSDTPLVGDEPPGTTTVLHSYVEGSISLASLAASEQFASGLRLVGTTCPGGLQDCAELEQTAFPSAPSDCGVVMRHTFDERAALSTWPANIPGLPHLSLDAQSTALMVLDGPTDPRLDSNTMTCLEPTPPTPLLVGAWPHADCGLDALTTTGVLLEPGVPDTGLPALDDTEAPPAAFGCAGRAAGLVVLGGLLGGLRRRRPRVTPVGRPPGARP